MAPPHTSTHRQPDPEAPGEQVWSGWLLAQGVVAALQPGPQPLGLLGVGHPGGRHQPGEAPKCGLSIVGGHQEGVGRDASTFKGEGGVRNGEE